MGWFFDARIGSRRARHSLAAPLRAALIAAVSLPLLLASTGGKARAEASQVNVIVSYGLSFLPIMVVQHEGFFEAQAQKQGAGPLKVEWVKGGIGNTTMDMLLTDRAQLVATGVTPLITLWDKTRGSIDVRGLSAMSVVPFQLNSRNPAVKSIADLSDADRIALPGVLITPQAVMLQMAAAKLWGKENFGRLDPLTVTMTNPDGMATLLTPGGTINAHFTTPPFQYLELRDPGVHKVTDSDEILGGPSTLNLIFTTRRFHDDNPKLCAAYIAALKDAIALIKADRQKAAAIYLEFMEDRKTAPAEVIAMLERPQIDFTLTPMRTLDFANFMHDHGRIKQRPADWKELFFSEMHALPGS